MALTDKQKKHLRTLAHKLEPVVLVGNAGVTPELMAELGHMLEHHELIKVRVRAGQREMRDLAIADLTSQSGAELVSRIGNIAVLYRRRQQTPDIILP
jgi:RNA-binding protein